MTSENERVSISEWVRSAPPEVRSYLESMNFLTFLRQERSRTFQMIRKDNRSISDDCKQLFQEECKIVDLLLTACLTLTERPHPEQGEPMIENGQTLELRRPAGICTICGGTMSIATPALKFLHDQLHSETRDPVGLCALPYSLFPRIARLMEDFAKQQAAGCVKAGRGVIVQG